MNLSTAKRILLGEPIPNDRADHERLDKKTALAVLSSDALSSVAYATEEILLVLVVVGSTAWQWSLPIAALIVVLLAIVIASYEQTIHTYPNGGGAYIVAKDNLGTYAGLVAGSALLIDYVLTVSVSIAAGVAALFSAFPALLNDSVAIGICIIGLMTIANLRGVKESGRIFAVPTYVFIVSVLVMICVGIAKALFFGVPPVSESTLKVSEPLSLFLVLRAFSQGCTALTGVEAISNGVPIFKSPQSKNAGITLLWMGGLLGTMFIGITAIAYIYRIAPSSNETLVSQIAHITFGNSILYYVVQIATALILVLAANTSFADFPRLASLLAKDGFLARQFANLGDRLVFSNGILALGFLSAFLLVIFRGSVNALIPLYAIGVFTSFTLSQAGMVKRWWTKRETGWQRSIIINALGAVTTTLVFFIFAITKFKEGAWAVLVLIPLLVWVFKGVKDHYDRVSAQLSLEALDYQPRQLIQKVIIPVGGIHRGILQAIDYAHSLSADVTAIYIDTGAQSVNIMLERWQQWTDVPLVVIPSPTRSIITPLVQYVRSQSCESSNTVMTVLVPTFVTAKWWQSLLHNQTSFGIRTALRHQRDTVVSCVRFYLNP